MNLVVNAFLLMAAVGAAGAAWALPPPACAAEQSFQEIRSIKKLPAALGQQLGLGEPGMGGIADRDERFNPSDAIIETLPMRRFRLASLGERCAVVLLERGGIAHFFELTAYELQKDGRWRAQKLMLKGGIPESQADLLKNLRS